MPTPSFVKMAFPRVGFGLFDQHSPFAVISLPPSFKIIPPLEAVLFEIDEMVFVVMIGRELGKVMKLISLPYSTPSSDIA